MNNFKDNGIDFDIFYDFNAFKKYIENIVSSEPVSFKCYDEDGYKKTGKITVLDEKELKIEFEGSVEKVLDKFSERLSERGYGYYLKDDNVTIGYNSEKMSFKKTSEKDLDFKNFIQEALKRHFPNSEFINTDKNGNISKSIITNNEIDEISYKNFHYIKGMDNSLLENQINNLKYNEVSFLNSALKYNFYHNNDNVSNDFLKKAVNKRENQLGSEIFSFEDGNSKIVKFKNIPKEYTPKEIVQSLDSYYKVNSLMLYSQIPVLVLSEEQRDLVKIFRENVSDFPPFLDFSFGNPEEVTFNPRGNEIFVKKKKEFDESIDKLLPEIQIYKSACFGDEKSTVVICDKYDCNVIADVGATGNINYLPKGEIKEDLLIKAKEISKYENRPVQILEDGCNIMKIKGDNISFEFDKGIIDNFSVSEKKNMAKEFMEKYNLEKIFENVKCENIDFEPNSPKISKEKINAK